MRKCWHGISTLVYRLKQTMQVARLVEFMSDPASTTYQAELCCCAHTTCNEARSRLAQHIISLLFSSAAALPLPHRLHRLPLLLLLPHLRPDLLLPHPRH